MFVDTFYFSLCCSSKPLPEKIDFTLAGSSIFAPECRSKSNLSLQWICSRRSSHFMLSVSLYTQKAVFRQAYSRCKAENHLEEEYLNLYHILQTRFCYNKIQLIIYVNRFALSHFICQRFCAKKMFLFKILFLFSYKNSSIRTILNSILPFI